MTPDAIYTAWAFLLLLAGCIIGAALCLRGAAGSTATRRTAARMTTDPDECDRMADCRARYDDQDPPDYAPDLDERDEP